ncbi:DUF4832 domain-containing protein [Aliivibrio sp. 1S128]|uniref:DUF4832 domain-containing protein n=1 Tax=Aliivibrio sp. 1S128 TaxID=1840085 RepID=UPI00080E7827|nr:DUF4832 domain-containing protein [Aliivibrio sp. 1S128]OCH21449.1 DUF4832 domain-containing protein [Aliivibrio sp. 1S128]
MHFLKVFPFLLSLFLMGCGSDDSSPTDPINYCDTTMGSTVTEKGDLVTTKPKISCQVLVNPDIGFSDFHSISIHDYEYGAIPSYPETSTVYFRWYWSELEKSDGVYNFALIDKQLNDAKEAGKKLMFRVMAMGETDTGDNSIPLWFSAKGKNVVVNEGKTVFVPDYTSSDFRTQIQDLLAALSTKYNNPDDITSVDIGVIGSWAEWHLEEAYPNEPALGAHLNDNTLFESPLVFTEYVTMHQSSFTRVPTVMLIGSEDKRETFLASAVANGSGWRADCLGDKEGYYGPGWNHMEDGYPHALDNANAHDAWKQAPVQFETCNDMTLWKTDHHFTEKDVTEVFDYALNHHASLINAKSKPIPDEFQPAVQDVLKKLGYRFELTSLTHSKEVNSSSTMTITSEWKNSGVAPSYYPYRLAYRFVDASGKVEITQETSGNVLDWLPAETRVGDAPVITIDDQITVPALAGEYDLQIALVNDLGEAKIKLAIDMPQKENWYTISNIQVN